VVKAPEVKFVCLDLETTGLEPTEDVILEIGLTLGDSKLDAIASKELLVWPGRFDLGALDVIVGEMHTKSGLLNDLAEKASSIHSTPAKVEEDVLEWLGSFGVERKTIPLMGSSVHFDRDFLKQHMPLLEDFFTYRNIDISSIMELTRRLDEVKELYHPPRAEVAHRALNDVGNTMEQARFYYETFFRED